MRMGRRSLRGWISLELFDSLARKLARHIPHGRLEAGDLINTAVVAQLEGKRRGYWAMYDLMRSDRIFGPDHHGKERKAYQQLPLKEWTPGHVMPIEAVLPSRIRQELNLLPARSSKIMYMLYWEGCTQAEVAREVGVDYARISQIHKEILIRLRKAVAA